MTILVPPLDPAVLARRVGDRRRAARHRAGRGRDRRSSTACGPTSATALTAYRQMPLVVVLPETVAAGLRRSCAIARTTRSRSCRAAPAPRCRAARCRWPTRVLLGHRQVQPHPRDRLRQPLRRACSPASPISAITKAVEHDGFYYAPDPQSQIACSIGGNVAENSGGVHCLKYGLTTNNLLGVEMVLMNGEVVRLGGKHLDAGGLRSAGRDDRLGRPARRRHRGDGAHPAQAGDRARRCCSASPTRGGAADCVADVIAAGHHPGRHGDDGPAGDPRRRGLRRSRLSARCRGAADRRARRPARSRSTI